MEGRNWTDAQPRALIGSTIEDPRCLFFSKCRPCGIYDCLNAQAYGSSAQVARIKCPNLILNQRFCFCEWYAPDRRVDIELENCEILLNFRGLIDHITVKIERMTIVSQIRKALSSYTVPTKKLDSATLSQSCAPI